MFLPTTRSEMDSLGWENCDIILVSGDTYIDSSYIGVAVIGKVLYRAGYKVGIIAQPNIENNDIERLGEPNLFWGVTAGAVDSMVANYTASKKKRSRDDFTPGGKNNRRPNRASIVYTNLIKQHFKNTKPIVLGGIEASLRRIAHYDFWSNKVRRSILFDAKADILVYGMGEKTILELAKTLSNEGDISKVRGICYISKKKTQDLEKNYIELDPYLEVKKDKSKFIDMFNIFYRNNDPKTAKGLIQQQDTRYLVQNPPREYMSPRELDDIYNLEYEREVHPFYKKEGNVRAMNTIKFSITSHRGCYGECNYCAIAVHQGTTVRCRTEDSIIKEAKDLTRYNDFKGYIKDVGGPTANMYRIECEKKLKSGACTEKRCIFPEKCGALDIDHSYQMKLLKKLRKLNGVKKVFVASGLRYDMVMEDKNHGQDYLEELVNYHISGQMKIAPEHTQDSVLEKMGKPKAKYLKEFKDKFYEYNKKSNKNQFMTYYLIAAHPGCTQNDMEQLKRYARKELKTNPEQVQIFTPTPSTYSTLMYYTEMDPFTKEKIFVEKELSRKLKQKGTITNKRR